MPITNKDEIELREVAVADAAAAELSNSAEITAVLTAAGIGSPKREELAAMWAAIPSAVSLVRQVLARQPAGTGTGLLIARLTDQAAAERERMRQPEAARQTQLASRLQASLEDAARQQERAQLAARLAAIADNDLAALVTELQLTATNPVIRESFHRNPNPHCNQYLAIEVVKLATTRGLLPAAPITAGGGVQP